MHDERVRGQAVAVENNLSETAFLAPEPGSDAWSIRWFTPECEVRRGLHVWLRDGRRKLEVCHSDLR